MKNNALMTLFNGYEDTPGVREKSFFCRKISGKLSRKSVKFFSPLSKLSEMLAYTTLRCYGVSFLIFGLLTIFIEFAKTSFGAETENGYSTLIVGAGFSLLAATLLAFDKPLCTGFQQWIVTDYVLHDFLRIKRTYTPKSVRTLNIPVAIIIGVLLGGLGYFVPAYYVASALGGVIYFAVSMASTEFSLFTTLLVLPLTPLFENDRVILCILISVCILSFTRKVITGKRFYRFEQYDLVLITMLFFTLVSGIFLGGVESFINSVFSIVLAMGYFAASNIITNRRLFECALTAISVSSIPITIITAIQFISSVLTSDVPSPSISATLTSSGTLSAFLTVGAICSYLMFRYYENRGAGIFFGLVLTLNVVAASLALRIDALLAIAITATIIFASENNKKALFLTIIIYIVLHFCYFIPQNVYVSLAEFLKLGGDAVAAKAEATTASFTVLIENILFGVGIGKEPFSQAIESVCGTAYNTSSSVILQMACEGGIFVPICFTLLMLIRAKHVYRYFHCTHKSTTSTSLVTSGVIYSLLLIGIFENIFTDPAIYCLFFVIFGIGSSMLRVSKSDHDEKLGYFTDTLSLHSSSVDISID